MRFGRLFFRGHDCRRWCAIWVVVLGTPAAACRTAGPEADEPLAALVAEPGVGPAASAPQDPALVAAKERIVPYEVEQGGTVRAIRDLLEMAPRIGNPIQQAEATFLAAGATLELVVYADLTRDDRPIQGLAEAWGATDRNGIIAAVTKSLEGLRTTRFLAGPVDNALVLAAALRSADHAAGADFARLNSMASSGGPFGFAAKVVLLGLHAGRVARLATHGPGRLLEDAEAWSAGVSDAGGEAVEGLDERSRAVVRWLRFALANAAAVRAASPDEPLAALMRGWLEDLPFGTRPIQFVPPLKVTELPESGTRLVVLGRPGDVVATRLWAYVAEERVFVGLRDELLLSAEGVERRGGALGAAAASTTSCPLPIGGPNQRRPPCFQNALVAAAEAAGGIAEIAVAVATDTPVPSVVEVLRVVTAAGIRGIRLAGRLEDGSTAGFPVEFREDANPAGHEGTIRIALGGFYIGKRGDLLQITRTGGAYDYASLARQLATRQPPFFLVPAANIPWSIVLETIAVVHGVAAAAGTTPILVPGAL